MKYNPAFLSEDELVESFVVRHADLDLIMRVIRENSAESNQHILVIGPRGSGKTMLVLRAAAEVRRDEGLGRKWYPLAFAEESYKVGTPGEFWLEALFHLGRQTGDARWKRAYDELKEEHDDERLQRRALSQLMDFADSRGKRILLIVENLNMLLGEQISSDDAWKLRGTLSNEKRVMLLATATTRFDEMENSGKAMFELFKPHDLRPLNEEECRTLWESVTGGAPSRERARPIHILTGGSPRLLAIAASFGARLSLRELLDDLMQLVDDHTDYFKGHLDNLPPVERKAYLALAELWDPSTAREVAKAARLDVSKTSAYLKRLMDRGIVVDAPGGSGRTKLYQVAERMYNIYYLMRQRGAPSDRVRAVVRFMTSLYEREELAHKAVLLEPNDCCDHHTPASILSAGGKTAEALSLAGECLADTDMVEKCLKEVTGLFIDLAARGAGREALKTLRDSASADILEPLVVALRLFVGEEVRVATEILEVAKDVVKRIREAEERIAGREGQ